MSKENGQNPSAGKLLVVDDDSNLIELVAMKLKGTNYEVATALKEEDALKAATDDDRRTPRAAHRRGQLHPG